MRHGRIDVVLDTNVLVSYLIGKSLGRLGPHLVSGQLKLMVCDELVAELIDVSSRPKLKKYLHSKAISDFVELLPYIATKIKIQSKNHICRDPKDNFLLDLASQSKANYLVTGDNDLLDLEQIDNCRIITPAEFIHLIPS